MKKPLRSLLALALLAIAVTVGCAKLTPAQETIARAQVGPDCSALGAGVGLVPVVGTIAGEVVAILCAPIADDILAAEAATVDGGAASPGATTVASGCTLARIPGDPLGQYACPELVPRVRSATTRRIVARATR